MKSRAAVLVAFFSLYILPSGIGAQIAPEEGLYSSDSAGLALESITDPSGHEYTLRVRKQDGAIRSELFHKDQLAKTWIRTYNATGVLSREAIEEDGLLREELLFDPQGRPDLERIFLDDGHIEETAYEYASGRLVSRTTSLDGETTSKRTYLYAPDGRLALSREESGTESGSSVARSGGSSAWRVGEGGLELRTYNPDGRLVSIAVYSGAERIRHEERSWNDGSLERVTVETKGGSTTSTEYVMSGPARGEIAAVTVSESARTISTERRAYDEKGRLKSAATSLRGREIIISYEYSDEDVLVEAKTSEGGVLASVVRHVTPTVRVEELYDSGALFARVRYEDGRRVLEEMVRDGVVIRTRCFP